MPCGPSCYFKTDYFSFFSTLKIQYSVPYFYQNVHMQSNIHVFFHISILLVHLAVSLRGFGSFFKMPSVSPKNQARIRKREHSQDVVLDLIIFFILLLLINIKSMFTEEKKSKIIIVKVTAIFIFSLHDRKI